VGNIQASLCGDLLEERIPISSPISEEGSQRRCHDFRPSRAMAKNTGKGESRSSASVVDADLVNANRIGVPCIFGMRTMVTGDRQSAAVAISQVALSLSTATHV
jgi:hypothetical protein